MSSLTCTQLQQYKCSREHIAIKTDLSKDFDRVEWKFLEKAMKTLGFSERWCKLIMECITSVQHQVLINGNPHGDIRPTRGIRQGDPLSHYLFVICTEMLVQKLIQAEKKGEITGLTVARGAPSISHLLYANDSMFYCKQTYEDLDCILAILHEYILSSGQMINYQKSSIYFGKNIPAPRREKIMKKLGIDQVGGMVSIWDCLNHLEAPRYLFLATYRSA